MSGDLSVLDRALLRWGERRGLFENNDAHEARLTETDVRALTQLFEMGDNELLDVLLGRTDLSGPYDDPDIRRLVEQMKAL